MTDIVFKSDVDVRLIDSMGNDDSVIRSMLVSTMGELSLEEASEKSKRGRINFLMANRHGTPFEHNAMTFYISAPIFVFREFHRHRIGWSYNEESGRYKQLDPVFYIPAEDRAIIQVGKPGHYQFVAGSVSQQDSVINGHRSVAVDSYRNYERLLEAGIAKEVARMTLPVNIFSSMYATCNARSLMAFLSLRTKHEDSKFPSYPQREIEMVAEKMEAEFARLFPITYEAYVSNGRVCP